MNKFSKYYKAVAFLEGLSNLPLQGDYMIDKNHADVYLKRMRYFLDLIGNPDKGMKFIHMTGTSGKGTVTNMLHEVIYASGSCVGSFTSPYVTTSIEKIKVNDKYISPDEFVDIVDYLKPYIDKAYSDGPYGRPSYFEIFLAISLLYFQKRKCDYVVLEVGLGGRFDATNVINQPLVTAITNIDYDHMEILGKTLQKIAYDKAGIIKSHSKFFTTEQQPSLLRIFQEVCKKKKVSFNNISIQSSYNDNNMTLVSAIAKHLMIEDMYINKGISKAKLMCRFETVQKHPLVILDGAHNRSKIKTTVDNLRGLKYNKLHLIVGIAGSKDHDSILGQLVPVADKIYFTRFQSKDRKCAHPKELSVISKKYLKKGAKSGIYLDPERALDVALKSSRSGDLILVTGSFFLAGEMRKLWFPEEGILRKRGI